MHDVAFVSILPWDIIMILFHKYTILNQIFLFIQTTNNSLDFNTVDLILMYLKNCINSARTEVPESKHHVDLVYRFIS